MGRFTRTKRQTVLARDNHRCRKCGATKNLTIDHIVPVAKGGTGRYDNLQTLCKRCNNQKGDMTMAEWERRTPRKPRSQRTSWPRGERNDPPAEFNPRATGDGWRWPWKLPTPHPGDVLGENRGGD